MNDIYLIPKDELYHYGVKGMKWGRRMSRKAAEAQVGTFRASNGTKVAPAKNTYVRTMRKVAANRNVENMSVDSYRNTIKKRHADTVTNRLESAKGEQRIRKESAALREYNAHIKDVRKGTGDKHLKKAVRDNKIDDAYEKLQTDSSRLDRVLFNDATRKKAAKYMVDNNMSMKDAKKKAQRRAVATTAAWLAVYGAMSYKTATNPGVKERVDHVKRML